MTDEELRVNSKLNKDDISLRKKVLYLKYTNGIRERLRMIPNTDLPIILLCCFFDCMKSIIKEKT